MPFARVLLASAALLFFSGCGYVHFGRLPQRGAVNDPKLAEAYSALSTEHKMLRQELVLARREGDALRAAADRAADGSSPELVRQLNETSRELATLRASYAKLQAERASPAVATPGPQTQRPATEEPAASSRDITQLQEENSRLQRDLDRARAQNTTLAEQLRVAATRDAETRAALAQLNTELLAQKEARARADETATAARAQLSALMSDNAGGSIPPASSAPVSGSDSASALRLARTPAAGASGVAELRTSPERLRAAEANAAPSPVRTHVVESGDTLEKLAQRYYGSPGQWHRIYEANTAILRGGQPLAPGMRLNVPEN